MSFLELNLSEFDFVNENAQNFRLQKCTFRNFSELELEFFMNQNFTDKTGKKSCHYFFLRKYFTVKINASFEKIFNFHVCICALLCTFITLSICNGSYFRTVFRIFIINKIKAFVKALHYFSFLGARYINHAWVKND